MTGRFTLRPPGKPGGLLPVSWFPSEALTMKTNLGTPTSGLTNSVVQRPVARLPKCNSTRELLRHDAGADHRGREQQRACEFGDDRAAQATSPAEAVSPISRSRCCSLTLSSERIDRKST